MVLEIPSITQMRENSKKLGRLITREHAPERLQELEDFIKLTEEEGVQDGGIVEGLPYHLHRNTMGNWCGYVGIFHDNPCYGKSDDELDLSVYGGISFAETVHAWGHGDMWWIGFDTSHAFDVGYMSFIHPKKLDVPHASYKDKAFVIEACRDLARQLNNIAKSSLNENSAIVEHGKESEIRSDSGRDRVVNRL